MLFNKYHFNSVIITGSAKDSNPIPDEYDAMGLNKSAPVYINLCGV